MFRREGSSNSAIRQAAGRPSLRQSEQITERLLECAASLFIELGYSGTSMNAIADRAGMGKQAIYKRYTTKDELFVHVYNREIARTLKAMPPLDEGLETIEKIRAACRAMTIGLLDPAVVMLCRIAYAEASRFPELGELVRARSIAEFVEPVSELVAQAQREGTLPAGDPVLLSRTIMMGCYGFPFLEALLGDQSMREITARDRYFEQVWPVVMSKMEGCA